MDLQRAFGQTKQLVSQFLKGKRGAALGGLMWTIISLGLMTSSGSRITTTRQDVAGSQYTEPILAVGTSFQFARLTYPTSRSDYIGFKEWATDYPDMDNNLVTILQRTLKCEVLDPVIVSLGSYPGNDYLDYPLLYMVEPESASFASEDIAKLREYLDRGGMIFMDDVHGPFEHEELYTWLRKLEGDNAQLRLGPNDAVFHTFYDIPWPLTKVLVVTGDEEGGHLPWLGGYVGKYSNYEVLIAHEEDLGDGLEWADSSNYPEYMSAFSAKLLTNVVLYALTH